MADVALRRTARVLHFHLYRRFQDRAFSSSTSFGLQFLVQECKLPLKLNSPLSQKIQFGEKASGNVKSVITFFKSHGFSGAEIAKLIQRVPQILHCRISSNLNPKFQYLIESGFKGSILRQIVIGNPAILRMSLRSTIQPAHRFLKTVLGSGESAGVAISRCPMYLKVKNLERIMKPNIDCFAKQGVPTSKVHKLILYSAMTMLRSNDKMVFYLERVKELGVMPHDPMFWYVLRTRAQISESTWRRKVETFKSLGWSDEDVASTLASHPNCVSASEKKLRAAFDFFVNHLGLPPRAIIDCPVVLLYSLQERAMPRCTVMKLLEAEKLVDRWSLASILLPTEGRFVRNFITKHLDQIPHLTETYQRSKKSGEQEWRKGPIST